ncbi:alpha-L-fucosidase [Algibacter lectus]|uniref:Alpha-L-fucosidase n=1 Tax=Algibacter lectus TaxID=221126 RepID=A0A090WUM0_9FLAO|nr:alpha-L-fucosidase C-terminal domain-containing protein [Algibacter lectus]GAL79928.1 alpha-L-fucosidase [Algibacter lectus]
MDQRLRGEITDLAQEHLAEMGGWIKQNSEGIYGSKPWKVQGERLVDTPKENGKVKFSEEKNTMKDNEHDGTSKVIFPEVRFTSKDGAVYAYVCSVTDKDVVIKALALENGDKIKSITRLNTTDKVKWKQTKTGLTIKMPVYTATEIPITGFKIELK